MSLSSGEIAAIVIIPNVLILATAVFYWRKKRTAMDHNLMEGDYDKSLYKQNLMDKNYEDE